MTTTLELTDQLRAATAADPGAELAREATVSFTAADAAALARLLGEPAVTGGSLGIGAATDVVRAFALGHPHISALVETAYPGATSLVHLEQEIVLHAPLEAGTSYLVRPALRGGRPQGDGTVAGLAADLHDPLTGAVVATLSGSVLLGGVTPVGADPLPTRRPAAAPLVPPVQATTTLTVDRDVVVTYADLSADHNPIHLDPAAARAAGFEDCIAHGMSLVGLAVSRAVSRVRMGPDDVARATAVAVRFAQPAVVGDEVTVVLQATTDPHELRLGATSARGPVLKAGWVRFDRPVAIVEAPAPASSSSPSRC